MEKVLFAEIDSLDTRGGCFAANEHFSRFLGVSVVQVSRLISKLKSKGYIEVKQENIKGRTKRTITSALTWMIRRSEGQGALTFKDKRLNLHDKPSVSNTISKTNTLAGKPAESKEVAEVIEGFKKVNPSYERLFANKTQRAAAGRLVSKYGLDKIINTVEYIAKIHGKPFAPTITTPYELESKLGRLVSFANKEKIQGPKLVKI